MDRVKKIGVAMVILLLLVWCIWALVVPSWQQRAAHNLDAIHQAIEELHPAVLEPDANAFHAWHTQGYEQAKALLPLVKNLNDEQALLRFYFAGYEEPHLGGNSQYLPDAPIFLRNLSFKLLAPSPQWLGWSLKYTPAGYKVIYSLNDGQTPPVGATLLSCDGVAIDTLLQQHFSPYFDRRWQVPIAKNHAARALAINDQYTSVLNRPTLKSCEFSLASGIVKHFPLQWRKLDSQTSDAVYKLYSSTYVLPSVKEISPKHYWINASDFMLGTKEAYAAQQALIEKLTTLTDAELVVFDLRANGGGSSKNGIDLLAVFGAENGKYFEQQFAAKFAGANAQFRVSQRLLWSYEAMLSERRKVQVESSGDALMLTQMVSKFGDELKQHHTHIWQSELLGGTSISNQQDASVAWHFNGRVVLVTDQACVSACLDFVDMMKFIPDLLHVGETTNGDTVYTQVTPQRENYAYEQLDFIVPIKKWNKRLRADNQPYVPDILYEGDMNNTEALQKWVLEQVR